MPSADERRGNRGGGAGATGNMVVVCQYEGGRLVHEEVLSTQDLELIFGPAKVHVCGWWRWGA